MVEIFLLSFSRLRSAYRQLPKSLVVVNNLLKVNKLDTASTPNSINPSAPAPHTSSSSPPPAIHHGTHRHQVTSVPDPASGSHPGGLPPALLH